MVYISLGIRPAGAATGAVFVGAYVNNVGIVRRIGNAGIGGCGIVGETQLAVDVQWDSFGSVTIVVEVVNIRG